MDSWSEPLPSYNASTSKDWLVSAGPYLTTNTLLDAVAVCRTWNRLLLPFLWGSPGQRFAHDAEGALSSFLRFQKCLSFARASTRDLCHTFELPPIFCRISFNANARWLQHLIQNTPNLQSLVLPGPPFLEHKTLASVTFGESSKASVFLRLLRMTDCPNITASALSSVLRGFYGLTFLDLSGTRAARSGDVLDIITSLPNLSILQLANIALRDAAATSLLQELKSSVRYLDMSHNLLTDQVADELCALCTSDNFHPERPPDNYSPIYRSATSNQYEDPALKMYKRYTTGVCGLPHTTDASGLQYLNLSGNPLSQSTILRLLASSSLQGLDISCAQNSEQIVYGSQNAGRTTSQLVRLRLPYWLTLGSTVPAANQHLQSPTQQRQRTAASLTLTEVEEERAARAHTNYTNMLTPALFPKLRSLVLTGVPGWSRDTTLSQALIKFIRECALESRLALLQTRLDYGLPPDRVGTAARVEKGSKQLFALDEIVLEMSNEKSAKEAGSTRWEHGRAVQSVTNDIDSEALWTAAASDFSFFDDKATTPPSSFYSELSQQSLGELEASEPSNLAVDTISEISNFRKIAGQEYHKARAAGETMPKVDGYWSGNIRAIRPWNSR